jgi:choline kinase
MRAILLAAGRGRRLGQDLPKCLIEVGGKSLLARHLDAMSRAGITSLTVVVGYQRDVLEAELSKLPRPFPVDVIFNEHYETGSIESLHRAAHLLPEGAVVMDADVLYPVELLRRLVASEHEDCLLLDGRSKETGEERMMLGVRDGLVRTIARRVGPSWDLAGESVGFAKYGPHAGEVMKGVLAHEVGRGRVNQEYEAALDITLKERPFGFERVDGLAWTEIDFPEDVEKATALLQDLD